MGFELTTITNSSLSPNWPRIPYPPRGSLPMLRIGNPASVCLILALAAFALPQAACAQAYPTRPVRIIVPFPAGGTTILMHNITFPLASVALAQAGRVPYDIDTDFAGISIAANVPLVITAHPSVPANNLREFVTLLQKDRTLKYNYGSTGPGSYMNIVGEVMKRDEKIDMAHIPLKGAAPLKQELLAGRLQLGGDQLSSSLAEIKRGSLKALATNAPQRLSVLPDVPTVRELGFPKLEADGWNGLFAPAKTPREIIERLQRETAAAVRHSFSAKPLTDLAAEPVGSTPAEQDAVLRRQVAQFRPIIRELGVTID